MRYIKSVTVATLITISFASFGADKDQSKESNFFEQQAINIEKAVSDPRFKQSVNNIGSEAKQIKRTAQVDSDFTKVNEENLKKYQKHFKDTGMLNGFDEKSVSEKAKQYEDAAKLIASQSQAGMQKALSEELGLSQKQVNGFDVNSLDEPTNQIGIFISFSMADSNIQMAMSEAVKNGATLYLNGMHPNDSGIQNTIRRLQIIGQKLDVKPDVRFKPRLFEQYNVTAVPTTLVKKGKAVVYAAGIMNINWLDTKLDSGSAGFLGFYGDTHEVKEKDIREEMKERFAKYDFKGKRKEVVDTFWSKQDFNTLPPSETNETWYIDITVKAKKDIINPRGDQLAKAGEIISPMEKMLTPLTLFIFDPMDNKQVEWTTNQVKNGNYVGEVMVLFTRIDASKGWDHLAVLREHFGREVYKLPKEMIHRFNLKNMPVKISSDMTKQLMQVEQFDVRGESK